MAYCHETILSIYLIDHLSGKPLTLEELGV